MKLIINGAGRIGRCLARRLITTDGINLCHINDPYMTIENLRYLIKYDTIYGQFNGKIKIEKNSLIIGRKKILFTRHKNLLDNIVKKFDVLIDASGIKQNHNKILKFKDKSKTKFIITHSFEKADFNLIFGINEGKYIKKKHNIISSSICDAVAIGPILNLMKEKFNFNNGSILTLHPWLGYQNLVDGPSRSFAYPGEIVDNFSLGRASTENLISKTTSCINALNMVVPNLSDKISAMSIRVPTQIVSSAFINLNFSNKIKMTNISKEIKRFMKNQKNKILSVNTDQCTSKDFISNEYSAIIDNRWTELKNNNLRLLIWYDNEFGYSSRIIDFLKII